MNSKFPVGFYSRMHLTFFIAILLASVFTDAILIMLITDKLLEQSFVILVLVLVILELIILLKYLSFPIDKINYSFKKNKDYSKAKSSFEGLLKENISNESKNFIKVQMLRYATVYEVNYCEILMKDIFLPKVRNESYLLEYYTALFEYYLSIGSHAKAKTILDALTEYKAPKQLYNKLSVLYSLYMDYEVLESELIALNPVDSNFFAKQSSMFGYALYYKNNGEIDQYEKYKELLRRTNEKSAYYTCLENKK